MGLSMRQQTAPRGRQSLLLILAAAWLAATAATAQPLVRQIAPFPVERGDGTRYDNPFSGGLIQPRIGLYDIDADGYPDLLALNTDNRLIHYRNDAGLRFLRVAGSPYESARVNGWFRLADIDADGDPDLLTTDDNAQVIIYHNGGTATMPIFQTIPDTLKGIIVYGVGTVPSLVDIDGDGDLDLFSGDPIGSITFYRNVGTPQSPLFKLETRTYMDILVIPGRARRDDAAAELQRMHGASVLDFADIDGDGDLDILFGDFFTEKLLLFHNDGNAHDAAFSMNRLDTAFRPDGDDVQSAGFNQPTAGDLDHDGDLDVLISSLYPDAAYQPLVLYRNTGTPGHPVMKRQNTDPTSEIDLGTFAAPTEIHDDDHDGLLVGTGDGTFTFFSIEPSGLRQAATYHMNIAGIFNTIPTAGDIDGDGKAEIVVGYSEGGLLLFHIRNGKLERARWPLDTFKIAESASPTLVDIDGDGDLDIIVGAANGRYTLLENIGTPTAPSFRATTPPHPLDTATVGMNATVRFCDIDGDGDPDELICGWPSYQELRGVVRTFINTGGMFARSPAFPDIQTDANPVPAMLRIAGRRVLLIGTRAGGMIALADSSWIAGAPAIRQAPAEMPIIAPNILAAGQRAITVRWTGEAADGIVAVHDLLGGEITSAPIERGTRSIRLELPDLPAGLYAISVGGRPAGTILVLP
ncbi:MAG: repeat protein [Chlorobi bacterium]|nr:repeat protein [Chlorobiota bacterium]